MNIWTNLKCIFVKERNQFEKATSCTMMLFWKRQNYGDNKKISFREKKREGRT
jgi:hypothetical protein